MAIENIKWIMALIAALFVGLVMAGVTGITNQLAAQQALTLAQQNGLSASNERIARLEASMLSFQAYLIRIENKIDRLPQ